MIPLRCQLGLNGLNFFTAAMQTAFGPFFSVYLTQQGWSQVDVGFALSVGTLAGLVFQLPAGWIVDSVHWKRFATALALLLLAASSLIVFATPLWEPVLTAEVVRGFAGCLITPAIAALTLILCGHAAYSERLGINGRYASLGTAFAAAILGAFAHYLSGGIVFLVSAAMVVPAIASVALFSASDRVPDDDHPAMLHPRQRRRRQHRPRDIFRERPLHIFALCVLLFHLANAAMLPLALNELAKHGAQTGFVVSAALIVPQAAAVACSPWAGRLAERFGRRPVLLFGFAALPLRGLLFVSLPDALPLVVIQALDGVSATVFGLTMPLIAADLTRRSGYLNLAIGSLGLAAGLGATASTTAAGWIADRLGAPAAFLFLAFVGLGALAAVWLAMPETRPKQPLARKSAMLAA
jgi:MFS family permease